MDTATFEPTAEHLDLNEALFAILGDDLGDVEIDHLTREVLARRGRPVAA